MALDKLPSHETNLQGKRVGALEAAPRYFEEFDYPIFKKHAQTKAQEAIRRTIEKANNLDYLKTLFSIGLFTDVDLEYTKDIAKAPANPPQDLAQKMASEIQRELEQIFKKRGYNFTDYLQIEVAVLPKSGNAKIFLRGVNTPSRLEQPAIQPATPPESPLTPPLS